MSRHSRRKTKWPTREGRLRQLYERLRRIRNRMFQKAWWMFRNVSRDLYCEEIEAEIDRLEEIPRKKKRAEDAADDWMEEHPKAAKRCWRFFFRMRIAAVEDVYSWWRKWRYVSSTRKLPTEAQFLKLWNICNRDVRIVIQMGELMHPIDAKFPRRAIRVGNRFCGSRGGVKRWFIENVPSLADHYGTLIAYKRLADKAHAVAKRLGVSMEQLLSCPQACSVRAFEQYLDVVLELPLECEREQPYKYTKHMVKGEDTPHHTHRGACYDNREQVVALEAKRKLE